MHKQYKIPYTHAVRNTGRTIDRPEFGAANSPRGAGMFWSRALRGGVAGEDFLGFSKIP